MTGVCWCAHSPVIHYESENKRMCGACNCGWEHPTIVVKDESKPPKLLVSKKLSLSEIAMIRKMWSTGEWSVTTLGVSLRVGRSLIRDVVNGRYGEGEK